MDTNDIQTKPEATNEMEIDEDEYQAFLILKPYIYSCLTLNHDINNPLAGIMGYAELLKEESGDLSESQVDLIDRMLECTERIMTSVNHLCDIKTELTNKIKDKNIIEAYKEAAESK